MDKNFSMPDGLDDAGMRAYNTIKKHLHNFTFSSGEDMSMGGCKAFYNPTEWANRSESYGKGSKLIVVYDGGDIRPYFNMDACYEGHCLLADFYHEMGHADRLKNLNPYGMYEELRKALDDEGFYVEECTGWYAAVYAKQ